MTVSLLAIKAVIHQSTNISKANWLVTITLENAQEVYEFCSCDAVNAASNS